MADCSLMDTCIFFNDRMASMPSIAGLYKDRYCRTDNSGCARYVVFKAIGRENVPPSLYPNDLDKARAIIAT